MVVTKLRDVYWKPVDDAVAVPRAMVAGSGLIKSEDGLWAVGDDLHHLVHITLNDEVARGYRLFPGDLPEDYKERKKLKPDTEAFFEITRRGNEVVWLAIPSGSKPNRVKGAVIRNGGKFDVRERDFSPLYDSLRGRINELNIEGATLLNEDLVLFQRGNGSERFNALIYIGIADFIEGYRKGTTDPELFRIRRVDLGEWDGAAITFTDGFAHEGNLIFSAAAERTDSTFDDGDVVGSVIGIWNGKFARELGRVKDLKIEGLALDKATENEMTCYGITDADETMQPSQLLRLIFDTL